MAQAFLDPRKKSGDAFELDGSEAHHLIRVVRAKAGDAVFLFDGARRYSAVLTDVDPSGPTAKGRIIKEIPVPVRRYHLRLFQGLPRGQKFDFVIEKAVELGVDRIVPFLSKKSPVRLEEEAGAAKQARWKRLIDAAAKQCNRADLPAIDSPVELTELAEALAEGTILVLDERGEPAADVLASLPPDSPIINLVVGPESGLSPEEREWLSAQGARFAVLGPRTLRSETAGLAALAILDFELNSKP